MSRIVVYFKGRGRTFNLVKCVYIHEDPTVIIPSVFIIPSILTNLTTFPIPPHYTHIIITKTHFLKFKIQKNN